MAERRPPGFNVDISFYDSDEVLSIPRKHRAAAVGVWTLCGAYSANKLTDGNVPAERLKEFGCTPAIKAALMATTPVALWVDGEQPGAIRFTRWKKWQRTHAEVTAYREAEAERKRKARESARGAPTLDDSEMSGRTDAGHPPDVRVDVRVEDGNPRGRARARQSETETKTEIFGYVPESATESTARDSIAATPAADLVRRTISSEINSATQTLLRVRASELLHDGTPAGVVEEALRDWATKTGVGPGILASLAADVIKRRNGHARAPTSKVRDFAELAKAERARENAQLNSGVQPKELE